MRVLTDPAADTGAVTALCLPQDVQGETGIIRIIFSLAGSIVLSVARADGPMLNEGGCADSPPPAAADVVCGGGVKYSQAEEALLRFAGTLSSADC
ncbi:hypothetical protein KCP75_23560 [Salmonella enterica subsp. enterica]|nr:hypothetical protein KCP75_23560 [Salmonella enterica subsp. enterica]